MLRDEIARYTELSGNDGEHTPIGIIGAYLDGYEKGLESRENIKGEWIESKERSGHWYCSVCGGIHTDPETGKWREIFDYKYPFCPNCGADMRGVWYEDVEDIVAFSSGKELSEMSEEELKKVREERSKLLDKLEQLRFFNQRAGRELWSDKSQELQDEDIKNADTILDMAISALSENKGEWIPVSERLPENNEDVLVYNNSDILVAWYSEIVRSWGSLDDRFDEYTPIIAWQPLPEPYKGVSE